MIHKIDLVRSWAGESFEVRVLSGARRRLCVYANRDKPRRIAVAGGDDLFDRLAAQGLSASIEWWSVCMDRDTGEPSIMEIPDFLVCRMSELSKSSGPIAGTLAHDLSIEVTGNLHGPAFYVRFLEETRVSQESILMAQDILAGLEEDEPLQTVWDVARAVGGDKTFIPEGGWLGRRLSCIDWSEYHKVKEWVAASGMASDPDRSGLFIAMMSEVATSGEGNLSRKGSLMLRAMRELQDDTDSRQDA